ncbi:hypothetical protein [Streptomyces sp. NPDC087512]|uniref:hypothetical protein n=1 Tax=unclassified Streptomyces TaxID=2593676 RepID=UPI0034204845
MAQAASVPAGPLRRLGGDAPLGPGARTTTPAFSITTYAHTDLWGVTRDPGGSCARLFKAGLRAGAGHRLERSTGTPLAPHTYAGLAPALSVLVTAPNKSLTPEARFLAQRLITLA